MTNEILKKFSDDLKKLREEKNITLNQIHNKTRIDKKYLEAIEEANFSIMPMVYIRAFIKEYSNNIGQDPNEILSKFDLALKGEDYDKKVEEEVAETKEEEIKKEKNNELQTPEIPKAKTNSESPQKSIYYIITALLMMLAIVVIYRVFLNDPLNNKTTEKPFVEIIKSQGDSDKNEESVPKIETDNQTNKTPNKEIVKLDNSKPTTSVAPSTSKIENQIINKEKPLTLNLTSSGQSWVKVIIDDKDISEFIIENGFSKTFNANEKFYLHIGNSGALKILLNGKELDLRGSEGKVRKVNVTNKGIEFLKLQPKPIDE